MQARTILWPRHPPSLRGATFLCKHLLCALFLVPILFAAPLSAQSLPAAAPPPVAGAEPPPAASEPAEPPPAGENLAPMPSSGEAEPAPAGETSAAHLQLSVSHFRAKEYIEAAEELKLAYALDPKPLLLFNIGQAYRRANSAKESLEAYEQFLAADPQNPLRAETEGYCNDMRTLISEQARKAQVERQLQTAQQGNAEKEKALQKEQERTAATEQRLAAEREQAERDRKHARNRRRLILGLSLGGGILAVGIVAGTALGISLNRDRDTAGGFVNVNFALFH